MFYDAKKPLKRQKKRFVVEGPSPRAGAAVRVQTVPLSWVLLWPVVHPAPCTAPLVQECCVSVWPWVQVVMRLRQGVRARAASSNREQQQPTCVWRSDQHSYVSL